MTTRQALRLGSFFFLCSLLCGVFVALTHGTALAVTEFCPAQLRLGLVRTSESAAASAPQPPAQLYSFALEAYGPRSVATRLAFHTEQGWFTLSVPRVALTEKDIKYYTPASSFVEKLWMSQTMYVNFPSAVTIKTAWVRTAKSQGDSFGWEPQGDVQCQPTTGAIPRQKGAEAQWLTTHDYDFLSAPPPASAMVVQPTAVPPFETTDCAVPFKDATVTHQGQPAYPDSARLLHYGSLTVNLIVAVRADGVMADAWVFGSSGVQDVDDSALHAAKDSEYAHATAFCQAIPGYYYFRITYNPE